MFLHGLIMRLRAPVVLTLVLLLSVAGCGTIANMVEGPMIMGGLRSDTHILSNGEFDLEGGLFLFLDFPLSFALDILVSPLTLLAEVSRCITSWPPRQTCDIHPPSDSCKAHGERLALNFRTSISKHGWFPHQEVDAQEAILEGLRDPYPDGVNCTRVASGRPRGGWQIVNAPTAVWKDLIANFDGEGMPVAWCGRAHEPTWGGNSTYRVVLVLRVNNRTKDTFDTFLRGRHTPFVPASQDSVDITVGVLHNSEMANVLDRINRLLGKHGLPAMTLDLE